MAYCTLSDLKTYIGVDVPDDDTLLGQIIARAQKAIDTHCRRTFEASTDSTKYWDAVEDVDGMTLYVDDDLCAVTTITNGDSTVLAATDYVTEPRSTTPYYGIRLLASSGYTWTYSDDPENAITIAGKWAYSTTAPADIAHACIRLAAWMYKQKDTASDAYQTIISGGIAIVPSALPKDVTAILAPYRKLI